MAHWYRHLLGRQMITGFLRVRGVDFWIQEIQSFSAAIGGFYVLNVCAFR